MDDIDTLRNAFPEISDREIVQVIGEFDQWFEPRQMHDRQASLRGYAACYLAHRDQLSAKA